MKLSAIHASVVLVAGVSLLVGCGPDTEPSADADTTATSSSPTSASSDDGMHGSSTTAPTTTASLDEGDTRSNDASTSDGSSDDGGSDTSTGEPATMFGRYALVGEDATVDPEGCAIEQGEGDAWAIDLDPPGEDGSFALHEMFGPYDNLFACTSDELGFHCTFAITVDYAAMGGADAVVELASAYDADWTDPAGISGEYHVTFSCTGSACAEVIDQWSVASFPCALVVPFTGVLDEAGE